MLVGPGKAARPAENGITEFGSKFVKLLSVDFAATVIIKIYPDLTLYRDLFATTFVTFQHKIGLLPESACEH
jgi:hypothetical protein